MQQDVYRGRIEEPGTLHRYGYVGGNPLNYFDVQGYEAVFISGINDAGNTWDEEDWWKEYNTRYYQGRYQDQLSSCTQASGVGQSCYFDWGGNSSTVAVDVAVERLYEQVKNN